MPPTRAHERIVEATGASLRLHYRAGPSALGVTVGARPRTHERKGW